MARRGHLADDLPGHGIIPALARPKAPVAAYRPRAGGMEKVLIERADLDVDGAVAAIPATGATGAPVDEAAR